MPRLYLTHVQQAALVNQLNDCYANSTLYSTLLACLWTSLQHKPHEVIMRAPLHADLCECLSLRKEPLHLWSRAIWKRCLRHWPHSGRQQDAADFLTYFQQAADLRHFSGSWAVLSEGCLRDCGQVCPLALTCDLSLLPQVRGMCSLQQAIHHWHSSSPHPALTAGAECIAVQLNRFCTVGRLISKATVPVSLPLQVYLPSWVEGCVQNLEYKLCAALVHIGETPKQGHYRALLVESAGHMWWTDDGHKATRPTPSDAQLIIRNSYILFFRPSQVASASRA